MNMSSIGERITAQPPKIEQNVNSETEIKKAQKTAPFVFSFFYQIDTVKQHAKNQ
jgi:hypothetical protein